MHLQPSSTSEILQGPIVPTMVRIGFPAVLGSLIFTLYNLAGTFWIGRVPAGSGLVALFMLFSRGWQRTLVKESTAEKILRIGIAHAGENSS